MSTLKSLVGEPGWSDDASQALLASRKNVIQLPRRAPRGVTSFQSAPPSDVRRIRSVPEPAAQPVLTLTMVNVVGAISGYGPTLGSGVGLADSVAGCGTPAGGGPNRGGAGLTLLG